MGKFIKEFKKIILISALLVLFIALINNNTYAQRNSSEWAKTAVEGIDQNALADENIMKDLRKAVTREDFALLSLNLYQKSLGRPLKQARELAFDDIGQSNYRQEISQAYELGLVKGIGNRQFHPKGLITRQEMAVLLYNTMTTIYGKEEQFLEDNIVFADDEEIAPWAREAVVHLYKNGIMKGVGDMRIAPRGNTTREQAITLIYKVAMEKNIIHHQGPVAFAEKIPVLTYHHLLHDGENKNFRSNSSVLSVHAFEEQMQALYESGYQTITLAQLEKFVKGELRLPQNSVVITFDDGYLSNYRYAYPILKKYNFTASIFMITEMIPTMPQSFHPDQLNYLSWEEMDKIGDCFEFGGHTHNLHRLNEKNISYLVAQPKEFITRDLQVNRELLNTTYFAYPYGQYNKNTIQILKELGYTMAFTTKKGYVKPGDSMYELKRYSISPTTSMDEFKKIMGIGGTK